MKIQFSSKKLSWEMMKGTVDVISSDPKFKKERHVLLTTLPSSEQFPIRGLKQ